ncbi:type 2 lanthipeptide synthetase LanM family protein [Cumulibacter manganitolerans]|uniref:type 2 lanthipeptide synthetase LanM family protein n=1 Tax=Cumulibacter manganitolerans TaxID=1884992 RepID=UPI001294D170|nr:type 2 lanthipeptide synthetase LanM family protein [Cumulibacter manganitolerans]
MLHLWRIDVADVQLDPERLRLLKASVIEAALASLVAAASSLSDRATWLRATDGTEPEAADERLDAWKAAVGRGSTAAFESRLAADGLSADDARTVLTVLRPADLPLPSWADTLRAVLTAGYPDGEVSRERETPAAFEELLTPFLAVARRRLEERTGARLSVSWAPPAVADLERLLLLRLSGVAGRVFYSEFSGFRAARTSPWQRLVAADERAPGTAIYDDFVASVRDGGLLQILGHYPVLARLMARLVELWVDATAELVTRLHNDLEDLHAVFGTGTPLGRVAHAETGLSDPHRGGRMVSVLHFECGRAVVYKPKDIGTEASFFAVIRWLSERGLSPDLRTVTTMVRDGYGWVEHVSRDPCADAAALSRYYRRAGMLACLVYALAGADCHRENIVASGEQPVLVDAECLLQHRVQMATTAGNVHEIALEALSSGVLGTGLLPNWQVDDGSETNLARDISALHTPEADELIERAPRWENVNTDAMAIRTGAVQLQLPNSVPRLPDGRTARLENHTHDLLEGFEHCYRFLLEHRGDLVAPEGPMAEREAMENLDIPYFAASAAATTLTLEDGTTVEGCLREPSADLVTARLAGLDESDLHRQLAFIAGSLHADAARHETPGPSAVAAAPFAQQADSAPEALVDAALAVAEEISRHAVRGPGVPATATWIAPQYLPRLERYQLQPVAYDLHSGGCGPALFLSTFGAVTGDDRFRDTALAALQPVRDALARSAVDFANAVGTGGATGLGSVIYAFTRSATLLGCRDLLEDATRAAGLLNAERVSTAPLDVFAGIAGELLALLSLYAETGDPSVLSRAELCGRRLVETARRGPSEGVAWATLGGRMLTGFSHGAAGIAYALARLFEVTEQPVYRSLALGAVRYESTLFDLEAANWRDLREDIQPSYKANWCHGAPGIGLARLGTLKALGAELSNEDLVAAVRTTMRLDLDGPDHLCCGNLGRAELLLTAGQYLGERSLVDEATRRAVAVVQRASATGSFALHSSLPQRVHMPGFFMGLSGIGYALLRTAAPEVVPSALMWR